MAERVKAKVTRARATGTGERRDALKLGQAHPAWAAEGARTGDARPRQHNGCEHCTSPNYSQIIWTPVCLPVEPHLD